MTIHTPVCIIRVGKCTVSTPYAYHCWWSPVSVTEALGTFFSASTLRTYYSRKRYCNFPIFKMHVLNWTFYNSYPDLKILWHCDIYYLHVKLMTFKNIFLSILWKGAITALLKIFECSKLQQVDYSKDTESHVDIPFAMLVGEEVFTQGLKDARQVLYHWALPHPYILS